MTCPRCQQENPAGAKFCIECATPMTRACANCGTQLPAAAKFCPECAHPAGEPAGQPRFTSPESYTPKHLAEKILTSKAALEGERKQVTVLFADMKGSMELLADRDPEEARKILDPVLELMMEAVHRYEGTVNQVMGDGIMALFGAPLAHEDHAVRACYAALRMQDAVRRYAEDARRAHGVNVQIRAGLNSGEVVVRSVGSDLRMDYTAVGLTTHLAARMEQLARTGTTLITADTLRLAEGYVAVEALGPVPVKGMSGPLEVYEVTGAGTARTRLRAAAVRGLTRFVGRDAELEQLRQALEKAGQGHGQVVAVVGEPGVGKSRLFYELTHSHLTQGWLVLEGSCVSYGKRTPFLPITDVLKSYFQIEAADDGQRISAKLGDKLLLTFDGAHGPILPAFLMLLDVPVEDPKWQDLDPLQRRQRTLEAVTRLLLREAQERPLLIVFENLHWMDSETHTFLDSLVDSLPTVRLLLLVNARPEYQPTWGSRSYYRHIWLDPLPPTTAEQLLDALLGEDAALQPLKRQLIERTEGNPFFLEETVWTLVETRVLTGKRGAYRLAKPLQSIHVPASVQAMLAARIDRLPPEGRALLQTAAVIGKDFALPLLQGVADLPERELANALKHLQGVEFIYEKRPFPEPEYTFKHALTHEVAYGGLLHEHRKALHAKVVEAIERLAGDRLSEHVETLARHALSAEVWEKAVDYHRGSGGKAFARGVFAEALERYEQALGLLSRLSGTAQNGQRAIDVRLDLHQPLLVLGQVSRLVQLHQEAEEMANRLQDQGRLGRISYRLGTYSWLHAEYPRGIAYAQRALGIASGLDDPELWVMAAYTLGVNHFLLGEYHAAIDLLTDIVDGPNASLSQRRLGFAFGSPYIMGCGHLAWAFAVLGQFRRAVVYGDRMVEAADSLEQPQAQAFAYSYLAVSLLYKGAFVEALAWAQRGLHLCEAKGLLVWLPPASTTGGSALARLGRTDESISYLERGFALWEGMGMKTNLSQFYFRLAEGLLLGGRVQEARRVADKALQLATASREQGNQAEARYTLGSICAIGEPDDVDSAFAYYADARMQAENLGMRPLVAHCHLGLGKLYRRTGKREEAHEHLTTAMTMYREMDMPFWLEPAEAEMRALTGENVSGS